MFSLLIPALKFSIYIFFFIVLYCFLRKLIPIFFFFVLLLNCSLLIACPPLAWPARLWRDSLFVVFHFHF